MAYQTGGHAAKTFGSRLAQAMRDKGMNYSDLARIVFGTYTDKDGQVLAKSRQSIGRYVKGQQMPDRQARERIATALDLPYADLFPDEAPQDRPGSGVVLTQMDKDQSRLTFDVILPTDIALEIIKRIVPFT